MLAWAILIGLAVLTGLVCARQLHGRTGAFAAAAIPWFGLLAWLLFSEYVLPYRGGGASMWPIAQLFAGTLVALVGWTTYRLAKRRQQEP